MQPLWKTVWSFLKNLEIKFPYDPPIPRLGTYPDKTIIQEDTYTPVFLGGRFTIAKTSKQPQRPLADEWIKMYVVCTLE